MKRRCTQFAYLHRNGAAASVSGLAALCAHERCDVLHDRYVRCWWWRTVRLDPSLRQFWWCLKLVHVVDVRDGSQQHCWYDALGAALTLAA